MDALARIAGDSGDIDKQIKWLESARKAQPKDITSRVRLIEIYLGQDKVDAAEEILQELENTQPEAASVLAAKARVLMAKKLYAQAQNTLTKLVAAVPDSDIVYFLKARNEQALGENKAALESIRKAYSLNKSSIRNLVYLTRLEGLNGHYDEAATLADSIIKRDPSSVLGYLLKGQVKLRLRQYQQALDAYNKALSMKPDGEIAIGRYRAIRGMKGFKDAMPILVEWLDTHPDDGAVAAELATAYMLTNVNDKAIEYFERSLKSQPDNILSLNNLAYLYLLNDSPKAKEYAERAYRLDSDSPGIMDTYGWTLVKEGSYERALTLLEKAAKAIPDNVEIQYHYAKALYMSGNKDQAKQILSTIVNKGVKFNGIDDARTMLNQ
jgi:putative PEP-CTERM system TPR-repeat lipoprotein